MGYILFLFFIGVPIIEISVFITVGDRIGLWPTLAAIFITAIIGASLLRAQGLAVLFRAQEHLNQGQLPIAEIFDGLCLLVAGAFLLTPGFVTDAVGFLLFVPPLRRWIGGVIGALLVARGSVHVHGSGGQDFNGLKAVTKPGRLSTATLRSLIPTKKTKMQQTTVMILCGASNSATSSYITSGAKIF